MLEKFTTGRGRGYSAHIRARAIMQHIRQKIAANTLGRLFVSPWGRRVRSGFAEIRGRSRRPSLNLAVLAHVYYLDIVPEILDARQVLDARVPLHLTVPFDKVAELDALVSGLPDIVLHACENRGRDIAPFLTVLNSGALDRYDAVLKLHTKRSPHLRDGEVRRKLLFAMLCGEQNATFRALSAFEDASIGLVGWRDCFRSDPLYWMDNEERVRSVAERMGVADSVKLGFFEGSMFWFRPSAFSALISLHLAPEDFEAEAHQLDGTLHHAVERCFTIAARSKGFLVKDLHGRLLD